MSFRSITSIICLFALSFSALADQLIIEPDMGREPIVRAMNETKYSLDLVMYGFTDPTLLDALLKQQAKGRTVKVILEKYPYKAENENEKTIQQLNSHHISWQGTPRAFRLTHQKTLIVDDKKAIIMTFNFTRSAFKNDRNFAIVIDDPKRVNAIKSVFSADWNQKPVVNSSSNLIFSPDDSRNQLLALINQAKSSIKIYAQNISDYKIVGALAKAARKGVKIDILTSSKLREKQADFLSRAGVNIHQSKARYIHAKVMVIDNKKAVIGSINLTRASLDDNRELSAVTDDPTVIKQLNEVFQNDWNAADKIAENDSKQDMLDKRIIKQVIRSIDHFIKHL